MPATVMSRPAALPAIVARNPIGVEEPRYLQWGGRGDPNWVADPASATAFPSLRDATRAATRLPSGLRAFGLPREPEFAVSNPH